MTLKEFNARSDRKRASKKVCVETGTRSSRRCSTCGEAEHNARTCKNNAQGAGEYFYILQSIVRLGCVLQCCKVDVVFVTLSKSS
jgi:hypothetical protein